MIIPFHDENPTTRWPIVTVGLVAINVITLFYMGHVQATQGPIGLRKFIYANGFIPVRIQHLARPQAMRVDLFPEQPRVRWGQVPLANQNQIMVLPASRTQILASLITAMFLHANLLHLLGNMWFLWLFGNNIEDRLGHVPFLLFYLLGGILASIVHLTMASQDAMAQPVIGASGAVAVVLGAYAVTFPHANVRTVLILIIFVTIVDLPALVVLGAWFLIQLVNGMSPPVVGNMVAWWAHIGGFAAGAVMMPFLASAMGASPMAMEQHAERSGDREIF